MMPSATNIKQTMKQKIKFSIESLVGGGDVRRSNDSFCEDSEDASNYMQDSPKLPTSANNNNMNNFNDAYSQLIKRARLCVSPSQNKNNNNNNESNDRSRTRLSSADGDNQNNNNNKSDNSNKITEIRQDSQSRSPSPVSHQKTPILVPGIPAGLIRPQILPPQHYPPEIPTASGHNPHLLAQFQALANVQAAQVGFNGHLPQHLPPHLHNPNLPRDSYPLYPWLLSRHGRLFPHRFPGSEYLYKFI